VAGEVGCKRVWHSAHGERNQASRISWLIQSSIYRRIEISSKRPLESNLSVP